MYFNCEQRQLKAIAKERYLAYAQHLRKGEKSIGSLAHRMKTLREEMEKEPPEVRERVRKYCSNVASPNYKEVQEFQHYPKIEAERLANALAAHRYVTSVRTPQLILTRCL